MIFNLYGGPSAGKSTTAAYIFWRLKKERVSVELAQEYVKNWAYLKREPQGFDQVYIFGKQLHSIDRLLYSGVDNVVTDSPIALGYIYARLYFPEIADPIMDIVKQFHRRNETTEIYIDRKDRPYDQEGRFQDEENARAIDEKVKRMLECYFPDTTHFVDYDDEGAIMKIVDDRRT